MAMDNLNLFPNDDVPEDRKEGEDGGERCLAIDDKEWYVVNLEAIGKVSNACPSSIGMGYDYDLVAAIYELL